MEIDDVVGMTDIIAALVDLLGALAAVWIAAWVSFYVVRRGIWWLQDTFGDGRSDGEVAGTFSEHPDDFY